MNSSSLILLALGSFYGGGALSATKWVYDLKEHRPHWKAWLTTILLWPVTTVEFDLDTEPTEDDLIDILDKDAAAGSA